MLRPINAQPFWSPLQSFRISEF